VTAATVRSTCPYCGVGCGVLVTPAEHEAPATVRGDPAHPANRGRLCSKGTALAATLGRSERLLAPRIAGREVDWPAALEHVAAGFARTIAAHGPDSVALYVSGQLLTEDYYVANKFAKGYLGTANIDTNSRLCMASAVAAHQRAFGEDLVPVCYEDLELADLVVLVGSNTAWCHPVLMQRILAARERRPQLRIVVIDPRRTATCEDADLHLPLRAGTDVLLFNGLLAWLAEHGRTEHAFVAAHTRGLDAALVAARASCLDAAATAQACGLDAERVQEFFELFAGTDKVVTAFSQGVNQSSSGTDKANSIINCHLLTGRIGRPGSGPFSLTGQPNAMGGREVGGLATQLAAHLSLEDAAHRGAVQEFWNSPHMASAAGLKAVELFDAIDAGRIRAVWIIATNPVVSLPDADVARRALQRCEFVVVSDCVAHTDTTRYAHVLLPAAAWGEKDGTVTNSDRHISRQRAFLPLPGLAQPDWWIVAQVAQRMGFDAGFRFENAAQVFAEHARLTQVATRLGRQLDLGALAGLDAAGYDALQPQQWPLTAAGAGTPRLFGDGRFATADGRAVFVPTPPRAPRHATSAEFPLVLNTGRIRDQWHTMTRTALAPQLNAHEPEPFVDLHRSDAQAAGIAPGGIARIRTRWGSMLARARCSGDVAQGAAFVPIHWSDRFASQARVGALVNPVVDPVSGEPEFKHTPCRVEPFAADWHGFLLTRAPVEPVANSWWVTSRGAQFARCEMAGGDADRPDAAWLRARLPGVAPVADWIEYEDAGAGIYRVALLQDERLAACLFVGRGPQLPARGWLASMFAAAAITSAQRSDLLHGAPADPAADTGAVVCACFGVGAATIAHAVRERGCATVAAVGSLLRAGTNCGSCRPELARLIASTAAQR
jgi:assimilatory nitrate reductase catalytic subunit